jgi:hypothetical protein
MALNSCPECNQQINDETDVCPHCGAYLKRSSFVVTAWTAISMITICFIAVSVLGVVMHEVEVQPTNPCVHDWHKCKDNADLVNNYWEYPSFRKACVAETARIVKDGEPKYGGNDPFSDYRGKGSNDYVQTGMVRLLEPDIQVQNQSGDYAHSRAVCLYSLTQNKVVGVGVSPVD